MFKKLSDSWKFVDNWPQRQKLGLLIGFALLAAIPLTIFAQQTYRGIFPRAATGQPSSLVPAYSTISQTPTFSWHCFCFTTKYRVYLRYGDGNFYAGAWYKDVARIGDYTSTPYGGWSSTSYPSPTPKLQIGQTYYWTVSCIGGGCKTAPTQAFTVVDNTPPTVKITSPANNSIVYGIVPINVSATDNDVVSRVEFLIDGSLRATDTTAPYTYSWYAASYQGKNVVLSARAYDPGGRVSTTGITVKVDSSIAPDSDGDKFKDWVENYIGTDPLDRCPDSLSDPAWPPDFNNDKVVNSIDYGLFESKWGTTSRRYDLDADGAVHIFDKSILYSVPFNSKCS